MIDSVMREHIELLERSNSKATEADIKAADAFVQWLTGDGPGRPTATAQDATCDPADSGRDGQTRSRE